MVMLQQTRVKKLYKYSAPKPRFTNNNKLLNKTPEALKKIYVYRKCVRAGIKGRNKSNFWYLLWNAQIIYHKKHFYNMYYSTNTICICSLSFRANVEWLSLMTTDLKTPLFHLVFTSFPSYLVCTSKFGQKLYYHWKFENFRSWRITQ